MYSSEQRKLPNPNSDPALKSVAIGFASCAPLSFGYTRTALLLDSLFSRVINFSSLLFVISNSFTPSIIYSQSSFDLKKNKKIKEMSASRPCVCLTLSTFSI